MGGAPARGRREDPFVHLHVHTEYSLLDGMSRIPELLDRVAELGQSAAAITDHGNLHGALKFHAAARERGINPIVGMEAYVAPGDRRSRDPAERKPWHLTLLAENADGYRNLLRLSTASWLEGHYYKPRIDRELLAAHADGLIVLSGCPNGELPMALREGRADDARAVAGWYADVFPGRYRIELQEHGQAEFRGLNGRLAELAKGAGLPVVLTNDSHYTAPEHERAHDVLLCVGTNAMVHETGRMRLEGGVFYVRSGDEMRALLPELPAAAAETARVAERVDIRLDFARTLLPDPGVPAGATAESWLRELAERGFAERYPDATDEQRERLRYELEVIAGAGFPEYVLIVRDIARFARERGIPTGVRGSAAASMVLYCLGVTAIEPTQYRLVFERFLNPERREMPDVDFDFADDRRDEVIRYAAERYGRDRVAQIATFGTLGAKAAIRDCGRALGMAYGDVDRVARMVPSGPGVTLEAAAASSAELREAAANDEAVRELLETARGLEGVVRQAGTHPAGVVVSREPLADVAPLMLSRDGRGGDGDGAALPTMQFDMNDAARIGLLKLDFLGLANLTAIGRARELIGGGFDPADIPDGDPETARLIAGAGAFGVFQLESPGMRRCAAELRPRNIRELAAMLALYRPGPVEHIPAYAAARHGRTAPRYLHPDLEGILAETFGVIVYQDQVLEIARAFAGYSLGQADVMRKAMGKKIPEVMAAERARFVAGAAELGRGEDLAGRVFDLIEPFAGYAFNKAHAFAYADLAWRTAWLKAHRPAEYMAAVLMSSDSHPAGGQERSAAAIAECARIGIPVLPPDVNRSAANFAVVPGDGGPSILFGLARIRNVGAAAAESLLAERERGGPFASIEDFAERVDPHACGRRTIEAFAKAGAFDPILRAGETRAAVAAGADRVAAAAQRARGQRESGQLGFFGGGVPALELEPASADPREIGAWERELLGVWLTAHPFAEAAPRLAEAVTHRASEIGPELAGGRAAVAGVVASVRRLSTRRGEPFAAVVLEDLSGQAEITVWPELYRRRADLLEHGALLIARVAVSERDGRVTAAAEEIADAGPESGPAPLLPAPAPAPATEPEADAEEETEAEAPLVVALRATDDEEADRALVRALFAALAEHPGARTALLDVGAADGGSVRLRLPGAGSGAAAALAAAVGDAGEVTA